MQFSWQTRNIRSQKVSHNSVPPSRRWYGGKAKLTGHYSSSSKCCQRICQLGILPFTDLVCLLHCRAFIHRCCPICVDIQPPTSVNSIWAPTCFRSNLLLQTELQDLIEANLAEAAVHQKMMYDEHSTYQYFNVGDMVWLSVSTAGKLDPIKIVYRVFARNLLPNGA